MARYRIFLNYDPRDLIGWVEIPDGFNVPEYAIQNGAILPLLRGDGGHPTGYKTESFGLVLRQAVDVNKPYVGEPEKETADERLGKTYRDKVTGFVGVVTQVAERYLQSEKMLELTVFKPPGIKETNWAPEMSCEPYTDELTLEQKFKAVLILASWGYNLDHFIKMMDDTGFLTPKWLDDYYRDKNDPQNPINSSVQKELIEIAGYKPEWFDNG